MSGRGLLVNASIYDNKRAHTRTRTHTHTHTHTNAHTRGGGLDGDQRSKYGVGRWSNYRRKIQLYIIVII